MAERDTSPERDVVRSLGEGTAAVGRRRLFVKQRAAVQGVDVSSAVGGPMGFGGYASGRDGVGIVWRRERSMGRGRL